MSSNYDSIDISIFGSDDFSDDPIREADAQFEEYIIRKARELKICKLHQGMPEGPTDVNGRMVMTTATVVLDDGREITKLDCWSCPYETGHSAVDESRMNSLGESIRKPLCGASSL